MTYKFLTILKFHALNNPSVESSLCFATSQLCDLELLRPLCLRGRTKYLINIIAIIIRAFGWTGFSYSPRMNFFFSELWEYGKQQREIWKRRLMWAKMLAPSFLSPLQPQSDIFSQSFPLAGVHSNRDHDFLNRPTWVVTQTPSPATWVVWAFHLESRSSRPSSIRQNAYQTLTQSGCSGDTMNNKLLSPGHSVKQMSYNGDKPPVSHPKPWGGTCCRFQSSSSLRKPPRAYTAEHRSLLSRYCLLGLLKCINIFCSVSYEYSSSRTNETIAIDIRLYGIL